MIITDKPFKSQKIVLALGLFDSVHKGHTFLINEAKKYARKVDALCAVFTFSNNPFEFFGLDKGTVLSFCERARVFEGLGVDLVIAPEMNADFAAQSPTEFLKSLFGDYCISAVFCGQDYTFGKNAQGNIDLLSSFCAQYGAQFKIVGYLMDGKQKISSETIRGYIESGNITAANALMGRPYEICGKVVSDAKRGAKIGVPTANILPESGKQKLKEGVYATSVDIDGKVFDGLTNVGAKPTFNDYNFTVETYILNFDGNIYGREICVKFYQYMRDIIKFDGADGYVLQIEKDKAASRGIKRTL